MPQSPARKRAYMRAFMQAKRKLASFKPAPEQGLTIGYVSPSPSRLSKAEVRALRMLGIDPESATPLPDLIIADLTRTIESKDAHIQWQIDRIHALEARVTLLEAQLAMIGVRDAADR